MDLGVATIISSLIMAIATIVAAIIILCRSIPGRMRAIAVGVFVVVLVMGLGSIVHFFIKNKRLSNIDGWNGSWAHTSLASAGVLRGSMRLVVSRQGGACGWYSNYTGQDSIDGSLEGVVTDEGDLLNGTWKNDRGQTGRFYLQLSQERDSFDGRYSTGDRQPQDVSPNVWSGAKVKE